MDTKKLYYSDSNLCTFSATVLSCEPTDKGYQVVLDQTAFFPTGGGQACDVGMLGGAAVLDVQEKGEQVLHLCGSPLSVGQTVTGKLNWLRRLDQMQQHSGEHIVSGLICKHFGLHNVGFHVGAELVTIDFDGPVTYEQLQEIEQEANRAIWQNLPIRCWYPDPEELETLPYRSKKALPWPVRIVDVPGFDLCACCGVHVAYTGQIGLIKLLSCAKFHQGVRIEMVCGARALKLLDRVYEQNRQVSHAFSAKLLETGEAARRINDQLSAEKFRASTLERRVFENIAAGYARRGNTVHFEPGLSSGALRELAEKICQSCGGVTAAFSGDEEAGYSFCLAGDAAAVKELGSALTRELCGKGGGKPGFFQGSIRCDRSGIEAFFASRTEFTAGQARIL